MCFILHSWVLILDLTNFQILNCIHPDGRLNRNNLGDLNQTVESLHSISGNFCDEEALPPLLLSLAYPGAYPLEKTDELVKAVWGKEEARASSHFSAGKERQSENNFSFKFSTEEIYAEVISNKKGEKKDVNLQVTDCQLLTLKPGLGQHSFVLKQALFIVTVQIKRRKTKL